SSACRSSNAGWSCAFLSSRGVDAEHVVEVVRLILAEPGRKPGPIEADVNPPRPAVGAKRVENQPVETGKIGVADRDTAAGRMPCAGLVLERELDALGPLAHDRMNRSTSHPSTTSP